MFLIERKIDGVVKTKNIYRVFVREGILNSSEFEKGANNFKTDKSNVFLLTIQSVSGFDQTMDALSTNYSSPADVYYRLSDNESTIDTLEFDKDK